MKSVTCILLTMLTAGLAHAADFPQWRGPNRDNVVPGEQPKIAVWPAKSGLLKVWDGPEIGSNAAGGLGSVVAAGGRVYLFATPLFVDPITERTLSTDVLRRLGWSPAKVPDDLSKIVEQARSSDERAALKGKNKELGEWIKKFNDEHLTTPELKKLAGYVNDRLARGPAALSLELLAKLETIKDQPFADQAALEKWLEENAITGDVRKTVLAAVPTTKKRAEDTVFCLNAVDGSLAWKKSFPGAVLTYGGGSTPCVADGRVYAIGSESTVYCLDAKDGAELWKYKSTARDTHSSIVVVDGLAIAQAGPLVALDAAKGTVAWTQPKVNSTQNSPTPWTVDGKSLLLCNTGRGLSCVEVKTGNILWTVPGGGASTAAVNGDTMVVFNGKALVGYRIGLDKGEKLWETAVGGDRGASPVFYKGNVYLAENGRVLCVSPSDAKIIWDGKANVWEYCSAVVADDKLLVVGHDAFSLIDASTEKFSVLAEMKMGVAECTTPAVVGDRMYIRQHKTVSCYDLTKAAEPDAKKK